MRSGLPTPASSACLRAGGERLERAVLRRLTKCTPLRPIGERTSLRRPLSALALALSPQTSCWIGQSWVVGLRIDGRAGAARETLPRYRWEHSVVTERECNQAGRLQTKA